METKKINENKNKNDTPHVYFDWAATAVPEITYPEKEVLFLGNPSSIHSEGRKSREALENARSRCAKILGVSPDTLYFTSGGSESNAIPLFSLLLKPQKKPVLFSVAEHPSVRENCLVLKRLGFPVSEIKTDYDGRINFNSIESAIKKNPKPGFISVMAVNNETGAINDIKSVSALVRSLPEGGPVHIHSDLVQAAGKISFNIIDSDIDSASFSAHKLGGPKSSGILYLKKPLETLVRGGNQEKKTRPGTENTNSALFTAHCLEKFAGEKQESFFNEASERMEFLLGCLKKIKRCILIPEDRKEKNDSRFSPWIIQLRFKGIPGEVMVRALDAEGISVSTGSACSSASLDRPVLNAMGLKEDAALEGIRISQGWSTTLDDFKKLVKATEKILEIL